MQGSSDNKAMLWGARILTGLTAVGMTMSAVMKLSRAPEVVESFAKYGYADDTITPIAITELLCTVLFVIPQTAVLGGLLIVGYLGGAVATHVNAGDSFASPLIVGVMTWGALFAREPRLRALFPIRKP